MKSLRPLWREFALLYYRRALKEICPLHPDVSYLVQRINTLTWERK